MPNIELHNRLNPKLWKSGELIPDVRYALMKIALEFYKLYPEALRHERDIQYSFKINLSFLYFYSILLMSVTSISVFNSVVPCSWRRFRVFGDEMLTVI